jgi:hypothetical protein
MTRSVIGVFRHNRATKLSSYARDMTDYPYNPRATTRDAPLSLRASLAVIALLALSLWSAIWLAV